MLAVGSWTPCEDVGNKSYRCVIKLDALFWQKSIISEPAFTWNVSGEDVFRRSKWAQFDSNSTSHLLKCEMNGELASLSI